MFTPRRHSVETRLIGKTSPAAGTEYEGKSIDEIIVGIARISSSRETNDLFKQPEKLLRHCLLNGHFSIFGMANLTFEIKTSRAIGRELIRHCSIGIHDVQEFSARYSEVSNFEDIEFRLQSENNRQSSKDMVGGIAFQDYMGNDLSGYYLSPDKVGESTVKAIKKALEATKLTREAYQDLIRSGVARETARMILPETAQTTLIFNGTVRSWITLLNVRLHETAQKECRLVAESIRDAFIKECPIIANSLFNFQDAYTIHILDQLVLEKWGCLDMVRANGLKKLKGGPPV